MTVCSERLVFIVTAVPNQTNQGFLGSAVYLTDNLNLPSSFGVFVLTNAYLVNSELQFARGIVSPGQSQNSAETQISGRSPVQD